MRDHECQGVRATWIAMTTMVGGGGGGWQWIKKIEFHMRRWFLICPYFHFTFISFSFIFYFEFHPRYWELERKKRKGHWKNKVDKI
jgi:hypothetical protein